MNTFAPTPPLSSEPWNRSAAARAPQPLPVRKLKLPLDNLGRDRWLVEGDPIFTHFLSTISAVFPNVEDFFVATVQANKAAIPAGSPLLHQVKGFVGQEAMHAREHREVNQRMAALGFDTSEVSNALASATAFMFRLKPALLPLAITASCEHFTVVFAKAVLSDETTRKTLLSHPDVAALACWHALEELEHKHVAFDVFKYAGGSHAVRCLGMMVTFMVMGGCFMSYWAKAVYKDREHLNSASVGRFLHNLRHQRLLSPWALKQVLRYLRRDFHPNDMDTDALMKEWSERLAGQTVILSRGGGHEPRPA